MVGDPRQNLGLGGAMRPGTLVGGAGHLGRWRSPVNRRPKRTPDRRPKLALLYSASSGQGLLAGFVVADVLMPLAGPRFSSGSAGWLSQHGIREMERNNLTRVLIAAAAIGTRAKANSPHPSSREGHRSAHRRNSKIRRASISTGCRRLLHLGRGRRGARHSIEPAAPAAVRRQPVSALWSIGTPCHRPICDA